MPAALLDSQLATLEPLEADEAGIVVDIAAPVSQVVTEALAGIAAVAAAAARDPRRGPFRCRSHPTAPVRRRPSGRAVQPRRRRRGLGGFHDRRDDLEEKIGQLFINHNNDYSPEYLDGVLENYHVGGMRYRPGPSAAVQEHIRYAQSKTKHPAAGRLQPGNGRSRKLRRRNVCVDAPAGRLAPGQGHRPPDGAGRRSGNRGAGLQLGVRADRGHPLQLAEHGHLHPRLRQHPGDRGGARQGILRRHQRVTHRLRHEALPGRRHGRTRPARGHVLQHPRLRGVEPDATGTCTAR